jgi:hypothetical protein
MNDDPTVIRQWRMLRMLGARRHGIVVSDMARAWPNTKARSTWLRLPSSTSRFATTR